MARILKVAGRPESGQERRLRVREDRSSAKSAPAGNLCLACTLCCNGGLFADLKLSRADRARLKRKSIVLSLSRSGKLQQPCQALCGAKCSIYETRPDYCRQFECLLLKKVNTAQLNAAAALKIIKGARRRLARAEKLLNALGDQDGGRAVSVRFRQLARAFQAASPDAAIAGLFGDLTLAMHDLNHYLAEHFYR